MLDQFYEQRNLARMIREHPERFGFDADQSPPPRPEYQCPKCNYRWKGARVGALT